MTTTTILAAYLVTGLVLSPACARLLGRPQFGPAHVIYMLTWPVLVLAWVLMAPSLVYEALERRKATTDRAADRTPIAADRCATTTTKDAS